ncbi:arylesterase [Luteibacter anthropi]|uniref:arylesterase n=1 Tax=Luteibacter anthropi TaxID=564369 RepID=UPI0020327AC5|nr:arylesterase [Luteibacter anthropi]URX61020.1 arylesterase [Luteibacter anthropi]
MRRSLMVLLLFVWCAIASAADAPRKVLVLGDSLSAAHNIPVEAGWVRLLDARTSKMATPWTMVNASISGETSLSGRNRLNALLGKERPGIVVIELGANDGLQGLPLGQLAGNLDAMIDAAKKAGARVLLLGIELPVNYGPQYRDGLRKVYTDAATKHSVPLVPFLLDGVALDPALMQDDGLHPTARGEPRVADNVWKALAPMLK